MRSRNGPDAVQELLSQTAHLRGESALLPMFTGRHFVVVAGGPGTLHVLTAKPSVFRRLVTAFVVQHGTSVQCEADLRRVLRRLKSKRKPHRRSRATAKARTS